MRKDSANVRCKLRRTKRNTALEGKSDGWVTPVTRRLKFSPPRPQQTTKKKGEKNVHHGHLHVAHIHDLRYARETVWNQQRTGEQRGRVVGHLHHARMQDLLKDCVQMPRHVEHFEWRPVLRR